MKMTPRVTARLAGALNVICAVPAGFSVFVLQKMYVRGDSAATAAHILGSEGLFRLGFVADIVGIMIFVGSGIFLYQLFKPASRSLALLMLSFYLIGAGIQTLNSLQDLTALLFLKDGSALAALTAVQTQAIAFVFIKMHSLTYDLSLAFFGVATLLIASLVFNSTFLPRVLGILLVIDGLGYLTFAFSTLLSPPVAARMYPFIPMLTAAIGEGSLMLWLIVRGVNAQRWEEQAAAAARQDGP